MRKIPFAFLIYFFAFSLFAENWPQWRGPNFNGSTTEKNLPTNWSKTENILWTAPLPGYSGATPAIWGDHVFVSSPDAQKNLNLICLNRLDGKVRWQKQVAMGDKIIGRNNMASPSPVTDGQTVAIMFGTGDLAAFDFNGQEIWKRNIAKDYGKFSIMWLYGSSPLLYKNKLYVQVLERSPLPPDYAHAIDDKPERESYLLCLDPKTGKNIWRHVRKTEAKMESNEAYSTPIPHEGKNGTEIIVVGGNCVTGHKAETGEEIWRCNGLNAKDGPWMRIVPSPVVGAEMIFACAAKKEPVFAIKEGGKGDVTATHVAWKFEEFPSDCVTPLFYENQLFVLDGDKQMMTCLDPKTGAKKWQGNLGVRDIFRGSPTGADGKIYCFSEKGTVVILEAGKEFKILNTIKMGEEPCRSSIAVSQGQLFIRTAQNLYCVGKK
ncbi:MAG: PQQ-binding-like beta-propeller repeat protein [Verrucomicrobiota bacterium]|nr:PQQ-binding-like beta-propeller repeat protein [Verrucomicrobiota bacterium]